MTNSATSHCLTLYIGRLRLSVGGVMVWPLQDMADGEGCDDFFYDERNKIEEEEEDDNNNNSSSSVFSFFSFGIFFLFDFFDDDVFVCSLNRICNEDTKKTFIQGDVANTIFCEFDLPFSLHWPFPTKVDAI